jgi:hypothetical protein
MLIDRSFTILGNKEVAKDSNADASTRATAAKDAASNKMDEEKVRSRFLLPFKKFLCADLSLSTRQRADLFSL